MSSSTEPEEPAAADTKGGDDVDVEAEKPQKPGSALTASHQMKSIKPGESEVEQLARRIETRRADRIPITSQVRHRLLHACRHIAKDKGYANQNKITLEDVMGLRDEAKSKVDNNKTPSFLSQWWAWMGFHDNDKTYLEVLERAILVVNEWQADEDDWFHFQDFNFYYTRVESRWPWMRSGMGIACFSLFFFYLFTPVLFCAIMDDQGICEPDDNGSLGWMSALYFASTTMSTVGYGDLSVFNGQDPERWRVFLGIAYMIVAIGFAILAFSAAAGVASSPLDDVQERMIDFVIGDRMKGKYLYQRVRWMKFVRYTQIFVEFTLLNLIGVFVSRGFRKYEWTWMDSLYWAVQTTTTIGYGDLDMPFDMRWFQIFYLMFSTYFVGNTLGKLAALSSDVEDMRRYYAWERREASKAMLNEMQSDEHDDVLDQYEFVVASLLTLQKVHLSDLEPIMNKYRKLSGDDGYIDISDVMSAHGSEPSLDEVVEIK